MTRFRAGITVSSALVLEEMQRTPWLDIELVEPARMPVRLAATGSAVRVTGRNMSCLLFAESVDIAPQVEVFRIMAREDTGGTSPGAQAASSSAMELFGGFVGSQMRLSIVGRRHESDDWRRLGIEQVYVEDAILLHAPSGQRAIIPPEANEPGALTFSRSLGFLEDPSIPVESISRL